MIIFNKQAILCKILLLILCIIYIILVVIYYTTDKLKSKNVLKNTIDKFSKDLYEKDPWSSSKLVKNCAFYKVDNNDYTYNNISKLTSVNTPTFLDHNIYAKIVTKKCMINDKCIKDDLTLVKAGETAQFVEKCDIGKHIDGKYSYDAIIWLNYNNTKYNEIIPVPPVPNPIPNNDHWKFTKTTLNLKYLTVGDYNSNNDYYDASYSINMLNTNKQKFKVFRYNSTTGLEDINGTSIKIIYIIGNKNYYLTYAITDNVSKIIFDPSTDGLKGAFTINPSNIKLIFKNGIINKPNFFLCPGIYRKDNTDTYTYSPSSIIYLPLQDKPTEINLKISVDNILKLATDKNYLTLNKEIFYSTTDIILGDGNTPKLDILVQQIQDCRKSIDYKGFVSLEGKSNIQPDLDIPLCNIP